ncbi:Uu.00g055120.m01.CDS01 [Anthostomella pinea]|uniref:Uu.00g055120.m01.CDS01 n=1 Tax=Anthostomella pinea TaxID=933095 RepID=A0AAI8YMA7_9PEZI|nr:Uu.00g055120.m01.CDS01 [Anthostomella pinea]
MGRTERTVVRQPASFRRDARAKRAKSTINKVIPALLTAHPRARRGIEASELIVDPPAANRQSEGKEKGKGKSREEDEGVKNGKSNGKTGRKTDGSKSAKSVGENGGDEGLALRITLRATDTLTAARALLSPPAAHPHSQTPSPAAPGRNGNTTASPVKVGILNMASPLSPGGGFLNGATSQEESLCMRTTLLPSLRDSFYRLPELGVVYTPDVLVFRDASSGSEGHSENDVDVLPKNERWFVDCVSAAMLRLPETDVDETTGRGGYVHEKDREMAARKMRAVMRVFAAKGCGRVVLGAWGCGAYGNPVGEVARAWRRVSVGGSQGKGGKKGKTGSGGGSQEVWHGIDEIVFAIKDSGMADAFEEAFGAGIIREDADDIADDDIEDGAEDGAEAMRMRELRDKIEELEGQVLHAKSPHMKSGLGSVLAGLRNQLPDDGDGESVVPGPASDETEGSADGGTGESEEDDSETDGDGGGGGGDSDSHV